MKGRIAEFSANFRGNFVRTPELNQIGVGFLCEVSFTLAGSFEYFTGTTELNFKQD